MLNLLKAFYFETQEIECDLFEEAVKCQLVVVEIVVNIGIVLPTLMNI